MSRKTSDPRQKTVSLLAVLRFKNEEQKQTPDVKSKTSQCYTLGINMTGFEGKSYRDTLAKDLSTSPKDERRFLFDVAKEQEEYDLARTQIINQRLSTFTDDDNFETDSSVDATPTEAEEVKSPVNNRTAKPIPPETERIAREYVKGNNPEGLVTYLRTTELSPTTQAELTMRFTKELSESIKLIAWTKERLLYTASILKYTLNSATNPNPTAVENLIQNYLIFCRIFETSEAGKMPRFGQFAYVMRSVFAGITTEEEIYERIYQHKTFGENRIGSDEVGSKDQEIEAISAEIHKKFLEAQEKKKQSDMAVVEAYEEEVADKGSTWSPTFSRPKTYSLPNYTFQTGPLKGAHEATGRSSWEPMLLAYADVINKRTEDRISAKTEISEEEKQARIHEQRVELLYEKFEFPVDIKVKADGTIKPVIYILDFIDINRWRAIEVKGPLTPKGAEKIRLFQKYYVEGDFSDLPEEKKIIMMQYVQDKKQEVADWCKENNYPVFEHFSSLEVLGAYKWDHDLNNFNRYKEAKNMKGLSKREQDQMQKGFFKLVEDRIASGRTPDIRPEGYMKTDKIQDLVQVNEAVARARELPYVVEKPVSTRPYNPERLSEEAIQDYSLNPTHHIPSISNNVLEKVYGTVPIPAERAKFAIELLETLQIIEAVDVEVQRIFKTSEPYEIDRILRRLSFYEFSINGINHESFKKCLSTLQKLVVHLRGIENQANYEVIFSTPIQTIINYVETLIQYYRSISPNKKGKFRIEKRSVDLDYLGQQISSSVGDDFDLGTLIRFFRNETEGTNGPIIHRRIRQVDDLVNADSRVAEGTIAELNRALDSIKRDNTGDETERMVSLYLLTSRKFALENGIPNNLSFTLLYTNAITNEYAGAIIDLYNIMRLVEKNFKNTRHAARQLSEMENPPIDEERYLKFLEGGKSQTRGLYGQKSRHPGIITITVEKEEREVAASVARSLLKLEIGESKYEEVVKKFESECVSISEK